MYLGKQTVILAIALSLVACQKSENLAPPPPVRDAIATRYVSAPEMPIRAKPDDRSPVLTKWNVGESVSVLSVKGDWSEIRMPDGSSGWAHSVDLADDRNSVASTETQPRFLVPPQQVYSPSKLRGEIVLEASVNAAGHVVSVRTVSNTTGSDDLVEQNSAALRKAEFYPLLKNGSPTPFLYTYRVTY